MSENDDLDLIVLQQAEQFIQNCDYPDFTTKFEVHRELIFKHLAQMPEWFVTQPDIFNAALISATVQATQERRTSGWTFEEHMLKVAEKAYDTAMSLRTSGQDVNPTKCAILGLLHDVVEDAQKNGVDPEFVGFMIRDLFGDEIGQQVKLLTMNVATELTNKSLRDEKQTTEWLRRIPLMTKEAKIVKLADIENNTDGETQRESKKRQRKLLRFALQQSLVG